MKSISSLAAVLLLSSVTSVMVGCHGSNDSKPESDQGTSAGGNGAFGENPAKPGSHTGDSGTMPPTDPNSK